MNVACCGSRIPKELVRALRQAGHGPAQVLGDNADAVIVGGGTKESGETLERCVESELPVFLCTLTPFSTDAQGLLSTIRRCKTIVYIPYHRRLSLVYTVVSGQVDDGQIGEAGMVKIHANQVVPKSYKSGKRGSCSTLVFTEMIHDLDWLNARFGPVRSVFAQGVQKSNPWTEYVMATLEMKNGVLAHVVHSLQEKVEPSLRIEVCGSDGIAQYDSTQTHIRQTPRSRGPVGHLDGTQNRWANHWSAFEELVRKRRISKRMQQSFVTPIELAHLTVESIQSGQPKKV